jgi:hypothetical protein
MVAKEIENIFQGGSGYRGFTQFVRVADFVSNTDTHAAHYERATLVPVIEDMLASLIQQ